MATNIDVNGNNVCTEHQTQSNFEELLENIISSEIVSNIFEFLIFLCFSLFSFTSLFGTLARN